MSSPDENGHHLGDGGHSPYSIKSLCKELMEESIRRASDDGNVPFFSDRDLYYANRNLYLNHPDRPYQREYMVRRNEGETDEQYEARREAERAKRDPIDYKYFTQHILKGYEPTGTKEGPDTPRAQPLRDPGSDVHIERRDPQGETLGTRHRGHYLHRSS
jgi:hypothetical protein